MLTKELRDFDKSINMFDKVTEETIDYSEACNYTVIAKILINDNQSSAKTFQKQLAYGINWQN